MIDDIIPIILSAGKGSRFGKEFKLLYKIGDQSILEKTLNAYLMSFASIIVITGHQSEKIQEILKNKLYTGVKVIFNENWNTGGMSSSVKKGIEYVVSNDTCNGVLIHPGDMPFITKNDVEAVIIKAKEENYKKLILPQHEGRTGHPLFIPRLLFAQALEINEESYGLKGFMKKNTNQQIFAQCSKFVLKDIDEKKDLD